MNDQRARVRRVCVAAATALLSVVLVTIATHAQTPTPSPEPTPLLTPSPTPRIFRYPPVSVFGRGTIQPGETRTFILGRSGRVSPIDHNLVIHVRNHGEHPTHVTVVTNAEDRAGAVLIHAASGIAVDARERVHIGAITCTYQLDIPRSVLDEDVPLSELLCYVPNGKTLEFTTRAIK